MFWAGHWEEVVFKYKYSARASKRADSGDQSLEPARGVDPQGHSDAQREEQPLTEGTKPQKRRLPLVLNKSTRIEKLMGENGRAFRALP
ncbi:hypothetical protein PIB30_094988 [Stylosanthes scabra]|uniref:Uncharacterized protein n=1 Tax=Stylosanthes scabra TaxID=79078 RepID=A0ABU6ZV07_9FABA|nr:hypothetical protein [Stylosanthes scabra]